MQAVATRVVKNILVQAWSDHVLLKRLALNMLNINLVTEALSMFAMVELSPENRGSVGAGHFVEAKKQTAMFWVVSFSQAMS